MWIPHDSGDEFKRGRELSASLRQNMFRQSEENYLKEILTGDRTCLCVNGPPREAHLKMRMPQNGERPEITWRSRPQRSETYSILFSHCVVIPKKACKPGKSPTGKLYKDSVLVGIRSSLQKARSNEDTRIIKLFRDKPLACKSELFLEFLAEYKIETLPHPAYSPNLAPRKFLLFLRLKMCPARRRFITSTVQESALNQCL